MTKMKKIQSNNQNFEDVKQDGVQQMYTFSSWHSLIPYIWIDNHIQITQWKQKKEWYKFSRKSQLKKGTSKAMILKKFTKRKLEWIMRDPKDYIYKLELYRGPLQKSNINIYDTKTIIHVLWNLPEEYNNIVVKLVDKLDNDDAPLTIHRI